MLLYYHIQCETSKNTVYATNDVIIFSSNTTHPFNDPFSGTTQVSRYQKGKTNLDFTEVRDSEWQWHQLGYMQVCISLQTDNHASTPPLSFYRPDALPAAQPTVSKHCILCYSLIAVLITRGSRLPHSSTCSSSTSLVWFL